MSRFCCCRPVVDYVAFLPVGGSIAAELAPPLYAPTLLYADFVRFLLGFFYSKLKFGLALKSMKFGTK